MKLEKIEIWSAADNDRLRYLWNETDTLAAEIGRELGRTRSAVIARANRMGLRPRAAPELPWTAENYAELARLRDLGASRMDIAKRLNRTLEGVKKKLIQLKHEAGKPPSERPDGGLPYPAGHPVTWAILTQGTSLDGQPFDRGVLRCARANYDRR